MDYKIIDIKDAPDMVERAATWFSSKWGIPYEAYFESMTDGLTAKGGVPAWYVCLCGDDIVGGVGVIENDFHNRPDLTPNACALYVEEAHRGHKIAGRLLQTVTDALATCGVERAYLLTDHDSFYERYGWEFYCLVQGDGEEQMSRMYVKNTTLKI